LSNDGNVDSVQMCLETHVRNHDISLLKYLDKWGGILVSRARYYQKAQAEVNTKCWGKRNMPTLRVEARHVFYLIFEKPKFPGSQPAGIDPRLEA
jgi:hypothetical protein